MPERAKAKQQIADRRCAPAVAEERAQKAEREIERAEQKADAAERKERPDLSQKRFTVSHRSSLANRPAFFGALSR